MKLHVQAVWVQQHVIYPIQHFFISIFLQTFL